MLCKVQDTPIEQSAVAKTVFIVVYSPLENLPFKMLCSTLIHLRTAWFRV